MEKRTPTSSDQLTMFDGTDITYDSIGNPLSYYNGFTFSWNGRQLYKDGKLKQTRHYGPDGKAEYDIDYSHSGDKHKFPHKHIWDWTDPTHPTQIEAIHKG